jgi:hypothetical protein
VVAEKLGAGQRIFVGIPIGVPFEMKGLEPVGRIAQRAAVGRIQ